MKYIFVILLAFLPSLGFSQTGQDPKYYLNRKLINLDYVYFSPNSIESINVTKDTPEGEIYIVTKEKKWKYKSLERFLRSYPDYNQIYDKSVTPIFIINNNVINYPDSVQIDSIYFGSGNVTSLSNVKGVSAGCKNLVIVNITLTKDEIIYIRGDNSLYRDTIKH